MKKAILLFPGQGSQFEGMGKDIYENFPEAKKIYDLADEKLGDSVSALSFEGGDRLNLTENTQPAILTHSIAVWEIIKGFGFEVVAAAGHSLGEYSALTAAESLSFEDAVGAVRNRGRFMQEAVPEGVGGMAAILNLSPEKIEEICNSESIKGHVSVANYNSPDQTVVTGKMKELDEVIALCEEAGAKRCVKLPVSAPFHSPLIKPAAENMNTYLKDITFNDPKFPVYRNVDVKASDRGEEYKLKLVEQVTGSVRWVETIETLAKIDHDFALEIGPGKVLMGLGRKICRDMKIIPVSDTNSINKLQEMIK
ncbi:MAG: ACP S-malonyltransferase [Nitrospinae bacterium]|nr:ACP S-malonyltransferase [Nitrospinota bacterium]